MTGVVEVAVAVLIRADGRVLLARRPSDKVYSGYWEFPGGKVEPSEPVLSALEREIREELGVNVVQAWPWIVRQFSYPHALVRLNFFRVTAWTGELVPVEGQELSWQDPAAIDVSPMLPANGPLLKALQLPFEYAITQAGALGVPEFMRRLESRLGSGLRFIQVREPGMDARLKRDFLDSVLRAAKAHDAKVLVNTDIDLAISSGSDGVHLNSRQLSTLAQKPAVAWCGASCHTAEDLRRAEALGVDFAVLGAVRHTLSHPGGDPMGWEAFGRLIKGASIPVYGIGGLTLADRDDCLRQGGQGIAMIRGSWHG